MKPRKELARAFAQRACDEINERWREMLPPPFAILATMTEDYRVRLSLYRCSEDPRQASPGVGRVFPSSVSRDEIAGFLNDAVVELSV